MKKIHIIILALLAVLLNGCSRFGYVRLNFPQEPLIYLSDDIHSIAVVNRSLTSEQDSKTRIVEAIATSEIAGSDKLASDQCLKGVFDGLNGYRDISIIFPQKIRIYGTGTRETPDVLDWKRVSNICDSAGADVLLVLETFDSNTDLLLQTAASQVTSIITTGTPRPSVPNQVRMDVYCYWRMYDPLTKKIIDQYQQSNFMTFDMQGRVPPLEALPQTAYAAGRNYSNRFLPSYYTVRRDLYKRAKGSAKNKFKAGYRRTEVANWQEAIEIWKELTENVKRKTAGRACLNIAVAYEVLGNTDLALEWAERSYQDYRDKLGRDYAKILLRRRNLEQ